jgi:hypothetical protein
VLSDTTSHHARFRVTGSFRGSLGQFVILEMSILELSKYMKNSTWRQSRTAGPHCVGAPAGACAAASVTAAACTDSRQPAAPLARESPKWPRRESEGPHPSAQSRCSRRRGFAIVNNKARGRQFCALQRAVLANLGRTAPSIRPSLNFRDGQREIPHLSTVHRDGGARLLRVTRGSAGRPRVALPLRRVARPANLVVHSGAGFC